MFRSLRLFNYRAYFIGILISFVGQWMQSTALTWVVLTELSAEDPTAVGWTLALQFAPPLLLVGVTGWAADRMDRRMLIAITQSALLACALTIGILLLTGTMTLPLMFLFAFLTGVATAFDNPARQAFVTDIVSREYAQNAIALNAMTFNVARLVGPAVAGVLIIAIDTGWVFVVNAGTFVAMLVALAVMRTGELVPRERGTDDHRFADGFRYVGSRPDLVVLFVMIFLIGAFGMNFPIYASTMALEFGRDADGFGILTSVFAIGSIVGALVMARRGRAQLGVVVLGAALFGVASLVSAFMPTFWSYAAVLIGCGFALSATLPTANAYVQTTSEPTLRGRVLALYLAVLMGSTPIGSTIVGWVAAVGGPRAAILVAAGAGIVSAAIGFVWWRSVRSRNQPLELRDPARPELFD